MARAGDGVISMVVLEDKIWDENVYMPMIWLKSDIPEEIENELDYIQEKTVWSVLSMTSAVVRKVKCLD